MNNKKKEEKVIKIVFPDLEEMPEDIYANNIRVLHGLEDIVIYFAKLDPPPLLKEEDLEKDSVNAKVVARIRLSPTIIPGFIKALEMQLDAFNKRKEGQNVETTI
jgi:hypothetical protein